MLLLLLLLCVTIRSSSCWPRLFFLRCAPLRSSYATPHSISRPPFSFVTCVGWRRQSKQVSLCSNRMACSGGHTHAHTHTHSQQLRKSQNELIPGYKMHLFAADSVSVHFEQHTKQPIRESTFLRELQLRCDYRSKTTTSGKTSVELRC